MRDYITALANRDIYSTLGYVCPSTSKITDDVIEAANKLMVAEQVSQVNSDTSDELATAARYLHIAHVSSQHGAPRRHGIIEREAQDMLTGAKAVLVAAGVLGYGWSCATQCCMHSGDCSPHSEAKRNAVVSAALP